MGVGKRMGWRSVYDLFYLFQSFAQEMHPSNSFLFHFQFP